MKKNKSVKKILIILALAISLNAYSQEFPTKSANGFSFTVGSKFTIKLFSTDSINFDYSVIEIEPFKEIVDTFDNDSLFDENSEKNGTIEFYFCLGTRGKTDEDKKKNMNVVLLMKNRTGYSLEYNSNIQTEENGEFKNTSNIGIHSDIKGIEIWPFVIYKIALSDFKKKSHKILKTENSKTLSN